MRIYLDESGDLGFDDKKKGASKYLVFTAILVEEYKLFSQNVNALFKQIRKKRRIPPSEEIKTHRALESDKKAILKEIAKSDVEIQTLILNKERVFPYLHGMKEIMYNFCVNILIVPALVNNLDATLILDSRHKEKVPGKKFDDYIRSQVMEELIKAEKLEDIEKMQFSIHHWESQKCIGLQAVDFVSNAIFRHYEYNKPRLKRIIHSKMTREIRYLF